MTYANDILKPQGANLENNGFMLTISQGLEEQPNKRCNDNINKKLKFLF